MSKSKYIYGVIRTDQQKSFGPIGKGEKDSEVYTIGHQDIACVVSDSSMNSFDSMVKEEIAHHLVDHQTVIEKVMKEHTIIPMKFGTVVANGDEVKRVLERGYSEFKEILLAMDNKIELDVAATWSDLDAIIKEMGEKVEEIRKLKEKVAKSPPSETLQDRIKVGAMIKTALDKRRDRCQNEMVDFLKEKTVDLQKHEVMDDKMILNCAFLLNKDKESGFEEALKELNARYEEKINFRCVGPLPPYSFSTIELNRVKYEEIDDARKLLELGEEATASEIKSFYRLLAKEFHPDKDPNNPELKDRFEKITKAYKLLASYCQEGKCSFKESPGQDYILIEIVRP